VILLSYHIHIAIKSMAKKKGTIVYLSEETKKKLMRIAEGWGSSQSSAVERLIREHSEA
jgi:hypothetical protein